MKVRSPTTEQFIIIKLSREDFRRTIRAAVRGLYFGHDDLFTFSDGMLRTIERNFERAWQEGARTCGILPEERRYSGLQAVLSTIFPFTDFRETCELQFVRYEIGNWACRCGRLTGLHHLRLNCEHCGARFKAGDPHDENVVCPTCGKANRNRIEVCGVCGTSVGLRQPFSAEECRERGMSYAIPVRLTFRLVTFDAEEAVARGAQTAATLGTSWIAKKVKNRFFGPKDPCGKAVAEADEEMRGSSTN